MVGGAVSQGTGIWSMHFTGMLALHLPVPIGYDVGLVLMSWVIAFDGSLLALLLTQHRALSRSALALGGLAIGAAIAGLHYTDMAAMRMPARTRYNGVLVAASIVVAVVFGLISLFLSRRYQREDPRRVAGWQWAAAIIMALAIVGQHYTGMAAVDFKPAAMVEPASIGLIVPVSRLPIWVLVSTLTFLALTFASISIDRRVSARVGVSRRLLAAQEGERRRIAQVLHEDIGQLLTALRLNLQRLEPSANGETPVVRDSIGLVDEALSRARALSVELRPAVLDDMGLGPAVAWYANRQAERAGYSVVVDDDVGTSRMPGHVETAGFRLVQEALTNIARHAKASSVRIALTRLPDRLEVAVTDDGVSFDVREAQARARAGECLGLLSMMELTTLAEGELTITSERGKGTTVRADFPLEVE
jgi:signal transduction histidine kinase